MPDGTMREELNKRILRVQKKFLQLLLRVYAAYATRREFTSQRSLTLDRLIVLSGR